MQSQGVFTPTDMTKLFIAVSAASHSGPQSVTPHRCTLQWRGQLGYAERFDNGAQSRPIVLPSNYYYVQGRSAVEAFIEEHPSLVRLLVEASSAIRRNFGQGQRIILEIVRDPEAEDVQELVAYIDTPLSVPEAMERLNRVDQDWVLPRLDETRGLFNINLLMQ